MPGLSTVKKLCAKNLNGHNRQVHGHDCVKIRATNPKERDEVTIILYAAKDLRNLVIKNRVGSSR